MDDLLAPRGGHKKVDLEAADNQQPEATQQGYLATSSRPSQARVAPESHLHNG
jgi:hypothetical protein